MQKKLNQLRLSIDKLDKTILRSLWKRQKTVKKIGLLKRSMGIAYYDPKRWALVLKSRIKQGEKLGLPKKLVQRLYTLIHEYSLEIEEKV